MTPTVAVGLTGALLSATLTAYVLGVYLPTLNTAHTSLEGVPHAPGAVPIDPGLARRLSVVVIDGLSYQAARDLPGLLPLRRQGVLRSLAVAPLSYTSAALVSFITGLGPRDSGTRRNGDLHRVPGLDSVLQAAGDAGVPLTLFSRGFGDFATILAPPPGAALFKGRFAPAVDMVRRGVGPGDPWVFDGKSPTRALDLVHSGEVDETGHAHGAASAEYHREAANAAAFVARYAASLDLAQDSLLVLSDHGHLPEGGHGGDEPEVSHALFLGVGGLFRRGVELGERPMRDVASTLSVLGGLRIPSSNLGLPMLDALALDDRQSAFLLAGSLDEAARFLCRLGGSPPPPACADVDPLVGRLRRGDPAALEEAGALHASLIRRRDGDRDARQARGSRRRLGTMALVLLVAATALALRRRRRRTEAPSLTVAAVVAPVLVAAVYSAWLWARGYRPTFSRAMPAPHFARDALPAVAAAVAAVMALAWLTRPGRLAPWVLLAGTALPFALLAAWVGADPVTVPPNVAGVLVFLLGPVIPAAAAGATAVCWLEERRRAAR